MFENRLILSQKYVQNRDSTVATLVDICGDDAIVELEEGRMLVMSTDNFKIRFTLNLSL